MVRKAVHTLICVYYTFGIIEIEKTITDNKWNILDNPEKFDIISNIKHIKHIKKLGNINTHVKQANQNKSKKQINSKRKN